MTVGDPVAAASLPPSPKPPRPSCTLDQSLCVFCTTLRRLSPQPRRNIGVTFCCNFLVLSLILQNPAAAVRMRRDVATCLQAAEPARCRRFPETNLATWVTVLTSQTWRRRPDNGFVVLRRQTCKSPRQCFSTSSCLVLWNPARARRPRINVSCDTCRCFSRQ